MVYLGFDFYNVQSGRYKCTKLLSLRMYLSSFIFLYYLLKSLTEDTPLACNENDLVIILLHYFCAGDSSEMARLISFVIIF